MRRHRLDQRQEVRVHKHELVLGVIDDVDDLFREQPRVDRVADVAAAGAGIVGLEMPVVVPGQGRDPRTARQTVARQGIGELPGALECLPVGIAVPGVIPGHGHDLAIAVDLFRVLHDRRDR